MVENIAPGTEATSLVLPALEPEPSPFLRIDDVEPHAAADIAVPRVHPASDAYTTRAHAAVVDSKVHCILVEVPQQRLVLLLGLLNTGRDDLGSKL